MKHQKCFIFIHQSVSFLIIVNIAFGYFNSIFFLMKKGLNFKPILIFISKCKSRIEKLINILRLKSN
ncbi:hypothetical protein HMPREF0204_14104 [Chryseobacterium gleum ATCC 35910]|uniref:Uncharacterized protein n=1 Tax=Chryseobacterium gleum ATCC 35910 TaxID=525257 RepID=A0ABN0APV7_CHRGE|nr:hypothetical protein HMPREF0204_14104 [Chryseobacterium gleum ATCC 35910]